MQHCPKRCCSFDGPERLPRCQAHYTSHLAKGVSAKFSLDIDRTHNPWMLLFQPGFQVYGLRLALMPVSGDALHDEHMSLRYSYNGDCGALYLGSSIRTTIYPSVPNTHTVHPKPSPRSDSETDSGFPDSRFASSDTDAD